MDDIQSTEQYFGVLSALRDMHVSFCEECFCYFETAQIIALQKKQDTGFLSEFLSRQLKNATAIICCNDEIAYWLIKELTYRKIRIPDDISVVALECSYLGELSSVPITSMSCKESKMGIAAAELILKLIKGVPAASLKLPMNLTIKRSSGPPSIIISHSDTP